MTQTEPHRWQIQALGALRVDAGHGLQPLRRTGSRRLLALLLISQAAPRTREALADALWPDLPGDQARRRLTDAMYDLRRVLPAGALLTKAATLQLDPALAVDLWAFRAWAASADPTAWAAAVAIYQGEALPEVYDDWALGPRVQAHELLVACLERLAAAERDPLQAVTRYQALVAADPLREQAHLGLMRALARAGRLIEARERFRDLEQVLATEFGLPPSPLALSVVAQIEAQLTREREQRKALAQRQSRPPFIGRLAERAEILGRLAVARAGHGCVALILGEPGIGKTRLAEELATAALWEGWQPYWGQSEALALAPPYAPLLAALQAALPPPRLQQLQSLVPAEALNLVTELLCPNQTEPEHAERVHAASYQRLATALAAVLGGLATIAPPLLILDDVQWAAPDLWPLLEALREPLDRVPVLILVLGRTDEVRNQVQVRPLLDDWLAQGETFISLSPLTQSELAELVLGWGGTGLDEAHLVALAATSGGNPLLALNLLRTAVGTPGATSWESLMTTRFAHLDPTAQAALNGAAVIGRQVSYPLWEACLCAEGLPPDVIVKLAGTLERAGWLELNEQGYMFAHDQLREALLAVVAPIERQNWHRRILTVLAEQAPDDLAILLHHAEGAADQAAIARYALASGSQALNRAGYVSARLAYERALACLPPTALPERYAATRGLVACLEVLAEREAQQRAVTDLAELADQLDHDQYRAEASWCQAGLHWALGEFALAETLAQAGLLAAQRAHNQRLAALLSELIGRCARDLGDYARAEQIFLATRATYAALGDARGVGWLDGMLGLVAQRQGRLQEAVVLQERAVAALHEAGDPYHELRALSGLALARWWIGDYLEARTIFERLLDLSVRLGDGRMQEAGLHNLGALADLLGDYAAALSFKTRALARSRATNSAMGVAVGLCNLATTHFKLGHYHQALPALDEALALDQASGRRSGEAFCWHVRGQVLAAMGQLAEARLAFEQAQRLRHELGERDLLLASEAELVLLDVVAGLIEPAQRMLRDLLARLQPTDRADLREQIAYTAHRVYQAQGDQRAANAALSRAAAAMHELLDRLPIEAQHRLRDGDPLHRAVMAALAASADHVTVQLVRAAVPLGRSLTVQDYVAVTWTITSLEDTRFTRPDERRQAVVRRLLAEAAAQGAAPTDTDLATVLGVSRRTILRDMAVLRTAGVTLPTRRRLSQ